MIVIDVAEMEDSRHCDTFEKYIEENFLRPKKEGSKMILHSKGERVFGFFTSVSKTKSSVK